MESIGYSSHRIMRHLVFKEFNWLIIIFPHSGWSVSRRTSLGNPINQIIVTVTVLQCVTNSFNMSLFSRRNNS